MSALKKKIKKENTEKKEKKDKFQTFMERPVPAADEVSRFEEAIRKEILTDEVENNLSAIYHDKQGKLVDVSKVKKRHRLRLLVLFKQIFVLTIIACALYAAYFYYFQRPAGTSAIVLAIKAPERVLAAEPLTYELAYSNDSGLALANVKLETVLPSGFVMTESVPAASGINSWALGHLPIGAKGSVTISGYLVAPVDSANVISAKLSYTPDNFSSEFKKEASANTVISGLGFMVATDYLDTALIGQNNELKFILSGFKSNYLADFYLEINGSDNFTINQLGDKSKTTATTTDETTPAATSSPERVFSLQAAGENHWLLNNLPLDSEDQVVIPVSFTLKTKNQDQENVSFRLLKRESDGSERIFWEKTLTFKVMKSDLNLGLALNGKKTDQTLNFGEPLAYSLEYSNNGDSTLYDLSLMVVVKGDFVQWSALRDPSGGSVSGNAIIWTKEQIPTLAELAPGASGVVEFSLRVKDFSVSDLGGDTSITSYAQYGLNNKQEQALEDNKSNTIKSQLNSDLSLSEKILYFNDDNIPIGSGPLPPRVGEKTSVRVLWTVKNNLHDLEDAQVVLNLPPGIDWAGDENTNVGSVSYNADDRQVTWHLGFLPLSVYRADAEFSISLIPNAGDFDKILVLSPGSTMTATDALTKGIIQFKTKAETTKLDDDEIAGLSNNGRVEQ